MSYAVKTFEVFEEEARRLSRKYPHIGQDIAKLVRTLEGNPLAGRPIPRTIAPNRVFKVRMPSSDMRRGKSGGFRVIYYLDEVDQTIYLLLIYAKSEQENIEVERINEILREL